MHMGVFAMAGVARGRIRTAAADRIGGRIFVVAMMIAVVMMVGVGFFLGMREDDFADAVPVSVFVGVRRRCRHDAKLRHGDRHDSHKEATKSSHSLNIKARPVTKS